MIKLDIPVPRCEELKKTETKGIALTFALFPGRTDGGVH